MKLRLVVPALLLVALAACGSSDENGSGPTATPTSASPSATLSPGATGGSPTVGAPTTAADLVGTWRDDEADWTVRFAEDGTFAMNFQGVEDFMSGTYTLEGGKVRLEGEGTDVGTVQGSSLVFRLGTLVRG